LHCCSTAGWCANSAGDTMSCCRALEYAEALDLSADRWAKMLVRRQEHDLEIIVAVAAASSRGPIDFRQSAGSRRSTNFRRSTDKNPHSEVHQSPGCPGVGYGRLRRFRIAVARARDPRLGVRLEAGPSEVCPVNLLLTITPQHPVIEESSGSWSEDAIDSSSWGRAAARGAPRSNVMSLPDVRPQANLLSEFVLAILSALGLGVPIAITIIWICS
jgi:hypothetical protein